MDDALPRASGSAARESAAFHATRSIPVLGPAATVGEARARLFAEPWECASHLAVCEAGFFRGLVRVEDLCGAPDAEPLAARMDRDAPRATPGADQEVAAWRAAQRRESALAVVDAEGRFAGVVPPHALLGVLLAEHDEDLARLGGYLKATASAREASQEPVPRRFRHRIPWLLLGLGGALLAAMIVGRFEELLAAHVLLAFFVPGIVYLADAVGTQTETIVVRGLSVGVGMRRMVRREIFTGLAIGAALACAAYPLIRAGWGDADVALGVSLALFAACSTATAAAMLLPWALERLGADPAFGAGPLATVVQDLLSILLYLWIVTAVVG